MELNKIWNEDNLITMSEHIDDKSVDVVLTSPFYNSTDGNRGTLLNQNGKGYASCRYDEFNDNMSESEYNEYTVKLFKGFNKILKDDGCVLYNLSYGTNNPSGMFKVINEILDKSNFAMVDCIVWKKKSAIPNNVSSNRLTRITEFVFVFARKNEIDTFYCNKKILSYSNTNQAYYENIFNFIEADNNDESCPLNKATYSTKLCEKLLKIYAPKNAVIYDPFMGSGTTAVACKKMKLNYIGSEISARQCEWAENRIKNGKGFMNKDLNKETIFEM